jgi:hypothetical protein
MLRARSFWAELSALGNTYYHRDLQFNAGAGTSRHKNWQERLEKEVDADLAGLEALLGGGDTQGREACFPALEPSRLRIQCTFPETWHGDRDLLISARIEDGPEPRMVLLNYRHTDHTEGEYRHVSMERRGEEYRACIPGKYFTQDFDVIVYISVLDAKGQALIYPGINHPAYAAPYVIIRTGMPAGGQKD